MTGMLNGNGNESNISPLQHRIPTNGIMISNKSGHCSESRTASKSIISRLIATLMIKENAFLKCITTDYSASRET